MKEVIVLKANKKHKEFIIHANNIINNVNDTEQTNGLEENIDKDYFYDNPKFHCLVAEIDNKPVGMILYSYFYWANDGEVLWISQMFVEEEYRKYGVFFKLIEKLREENKDIQIVSCATGDENKKMQKILKYYGSNEINLKFYYKKI
jgi:GNAT superfamily N-acetyltransferase